MEFYLLLFLSVFVSAFGSIVGFGGGVFMIPILVIGFGFPIKLAIGSVILSLIPATAISSFFNMRNSSIDYVAAVILEIPTILGTILGAFLTTILPVKIVEITFAIIILSVGISSIRKAKVHLLRRNKNTFLYKLNNVGGAIIRKSPFGAYKINYLLGFLFGSTSGMVAGFLGIGGGFLKVPIMINIFKMPSFIASSTALFMIFFTSLTGGVSHFLLGNINFSSALPIVIGFSIGAIGGNLLNAKLSEQKLKILIGGGLILASCSILFYSIFN